MCEGVRVCGWEGEQFQSLKVYLYSFTFLSSLSLLPFFFYPPPPPFLQVLLSSPPTPQATHHVRLDSLAIGRPSLVDVLAHTIRPNKRDGSNGRVITDEINSYAHTHEERRGKD